MGGISAFELGFGDKWNVEMEQSVAESPTQTICTLAYALVAHIAIYMHTSQFWPLLQLRTALTHLNIRREALENSS